MPKVASGCQPDNQQSADSTDQSFGKQHRLLNSAQYQFVFDDAKPVRSPAFTLLYRPNNQASARCGVIVSRKSDAKSAGRNRIKRVIRESFRHNRESLPKVDMIVLARPQASSSDNAQLFQQLASLWQKLKKQ